MVNVLGLLAGLPQDIHKRQDTSSQGTSSWSSVVLTSFSSDPGHVATSVTVSGYDYPAVVVSNSVTFTTRRTVTYAPSFSPIVLPLTTTFTPSPACFSEYSIIDNSAAYLTYSAPPLQLPGDDHPECFPEKNFFVTYYSPGLCPFGYSIDNTGLVAVPTGRDTVTETIAVCCPSGHQASGTYCWNYINSSPTFKPGAVTTSQLVLRPYSVTVRYTSQQFGSFTSLNAAGSATAISVSATKTSSGLTIITGTGVASIRAKRIVVRWQSTDSQIASWYAQQNGNVTGGTNGGSTSSSGSKSSGLSGGAIAGIVVGAIVGLMLVIFAILCLCRRSRKSRAKESPQSDSIPVHQTGDTGYTHEGYGHNGGFGQAYYNPNPAELDSKSVSPGVAGAGWATRSPQNPPAELSADPHTRHMSMASNVSDRSSAIAVDHTMHPAASPPPESYADFTAGNSQAESSPVGSDQAVPAAPARSSAQLLREQQARIRAERTRLERLQELSEMDNMLEARLKDEMDRERSSQATA